jgi:phosphate transport system substrate-binding protein
MAASGNSGVSALIKKTPYSIGYLELGYAKQEKIAFAEVRNRNGEFVEPDITSISAAITGDGLSLTDSASQGAYPIVGLTYMLAYHDQTSRLKGKALKSFLNWAATSGQELAGPLYYAPLPERFSKKIFKTIDSIKVP